MLGRLSHPLLGLPMCGVARRLLREGLENMSEVLIPAPDVRSVRGEGMEEFWI